ncbi:hypothetical protein ACWDUL_21010 [Nocardia niigatensis]
MRRFSIAVDGGGEAFSLLPIAISATRAMANRTGASAWCRAVDDGVGILEVAEVQGRDQVQGLGADWWIVVSSKDSLGFLGVSARAMGFGATFGDAEAMPDPVPVAEDGATSGHEGAPFAGGMVGMAVFAVLVSGELGHGVSSGCSGRG